MNSAERKVWEVNVSRELVRAKRFATREIGKMETELRTTLEAIERSMKKDPRQAALVALSLGAAIGAAGVHLLKSKKGRRSRR
ncbi:MAG: hypothetical protein ACEQSB_02440 [Undibacterium sp.]